MSRRTLLSTYSRVGHSSQPHHIYICTDYLQYSGSLRVRLHSAHSTHLSHADAHTYVTSQELSVDKRIKDPLVDTTCCQLCHSCQIRRRPRRRTPDYGEPPSLDASLADPPTPPLAPGQQRAQDLAFMDPACTALALMPCESAVARDLHASSGGRSRWRHEPEDGRAHL